MLRITNMTALKKGLLCERCKMVIKRFELVPHKNSFYCGDCYIIDTNEQDENEITMDIFLETNSLSGCGIEQMQIYSSPPKRETKTNYPKTRKKRTRR